MQIQSAGTAQLSPKEDIGATISIAQQQVENNWHKNLFIIAKNYGRIDPDSTIEKWSQTKLEKLFTATEMRVAHDTAVAGVLGEIEDAAGKGMLLTMWNIYRTGQWVAFKPQAKTNESDWTFQQFVTVGMVNAKTADYRQKLSLVCERVFMWLERHKLGDENGEKVDPLYMIRHCGPYTLIQISQSIFSKQPDCYTIRQALKAILASDSPDDEIQHWSTKIDRIKNGMDGNRYFVRQNKEGAHIFHIEISDPKLAKGLMKKLDKLGEMHLWADTNIEEPVYETEPVNGVHEQDQQRHLQEGQGRESITEVGVLI